MNLLPRFFSAQVPGQIRTSDAKLEIHGFSNSTKSDGNGAEVSFAGYPVPTILRNAVRGRCVVRATRTVFARLFRLLAASRLRRNAVCAPRTFPATLTVALALISASACHYPFSGDPPAAAAIVVP